MKHKYKYQYRTERRITKILVQSKSMEGNLLKGSIEIVERVPSNWLIERFGAVGILQYGAGSALKLSIRCYVMHSFGSILLSYPPPPSLPLSAPPCIPPGKPLVESGGNLEMKQSSRWKQEQNMGST